MHGKNRLPVKLKDLQADQERIYKTAWIKCLSLLPSLSSLVRHVVSLSSITTLINTSGAEPLSPHSDSQTTTRTLVRRTHKLPFEKERVIFQDEGNKEKLSQEDKTHKNTRLVFWVSAPNRTTFIHDTRKFTALSYRTAEDLLEVKVL